jgi:hypothetical protein
LYAVAAMAIPSIDGPAAVLVDLEQGVSLQTKGADVLFNVVHFA